MNTNNIEHYLNNLTKEEYLELLCEFMLKTGQRANFVAWAEDHFFDDNFGDSDIPWEPILCAQTGVPQ